MTQGARGGGDPGAVAALSANALTVLRHRYLRPRADDGRLETPGELFERVARTIAAVDARYGADEYEVERVAQRFLARMRALEFLPNSPTLMNAGRERGQLAACFVVPVEDDTASIFDAMKWAALIQKTGGGTGFSFSRLRPNGELVASTGGLASGPVAFMQVFDMATEAIKQGGARRGANMGVLRVDHPDILEFIAVKLDPTRMRNFNLSVAVTDAFMEAAARGEAYALRRPRTGEVVRELEARRVLTAIANAAWATGDPGLIFIDRINATQPTPALGEIEATNPCGEQPLLPFEPCTLGSLNLAKFVVEEGGRAEVDWGRLRRAIADGVHFLDNVVDANAYPLDAIAEAAATTRKIGLGVMGFADMLIALGIPYDHEQAVLLAHRIAEVLDGESVAASRALAEARGAFPAFGQSRWAGEGAPMRNATTTTIAPTGTISILAGCSSGIEPLYAVAFERRVLDGELLSEFHPELRRRLEARGLWTEALGAQLAERGRARGFQAIPDDLQRLFPAAHDIAPEVHIDIQAAFQHFVHAGVSKTINLPFEATADEVAHAYQLAYDKGCKGVTVYRDGSKTSQVLGFGRRDEPRPELDACPVCGEAMPHTSGCRVCRACGWSVCG
jgi:ribonucleoside-diphosphate reductase alpha chain